MTTVIVAVADIALVTFVLYQVLRLIRGTRALQMLFGMGLLLAGGYALKTVGFATLGFLIDNFTNALILVVIVVFQHDIRRALARLGRTGLFRQQSYGHGSSLPEELTRAAVAMAADHMGALIVIEREGDLGEWAESGIRLDARVTNELIVQLLTPPGPVHDGAIIIQQGRISAAGCFLPLTANPRVDKRLGTRHRAAIGITEEMDSVAIVVSEEHGKISLCEQGRITRDLDGGTLRKVLQAYFGKPG